MRRSARIRGMTAPRPESIVFDVGQVLVEVEPRALLAYLGGGATGCDDLETVCARVDLDAHERGDYGGAQLLTRLAGLARRPLDVERLHTLWLSIYRPARPMLALAARLRASYRVSLVSNLGELHWRHLWDHYRLGSLAHGAVVSFEARTLKPDPAIDRLAEERFALEPARTLFVDDRAANVAAASAHGWRGIVHRTPVATEAWLAGCGVQVPC
jgi:2-haloacid dehalogenase